MNKIYLLTMLALGWGGLSMTAQVSEGGIASQQPSSNPAKWKTEHVSSQQEKSAQSGMGDPRKVLNLLQGSTLRSSTSTQLDSALWVYVNESSNTKVYYMYNDDGLLSEQNTYTGSTLSSQCIYTYDDNGICSGYTLTNYTNGEASSKTIYGYDSNGKVVLHEEYSASGEGTDLTLQAGSYAAYDDNGNQTLDKTVCLSDDGLLETEQLLEEYDAEGRITLSDFLIDTSSSRKHTIRTYTYTDESTGTCFYRDSTISGETVTTSFIYFDCTYDPDGNLLSEIAYEGDPTTETAVSGQTSLYDYTYDTQGRLLTSIYSEYNNNAEGGGITYYFEKEEYEYKGENYTYTYAYMKYSSTETERAWTITKQREYTEIDEQNYYYWDYDLNEEVLEITSGYKHEYDEASGTESEYNWDTKENDWKLTSSTIYVYESDGMNTTYYYYEWEDEAWVLLEGYKLVYVGTGSPTSSSTTGVADIYQYYEPTATIGGDDPLEWTLAAYVYKFYSDPTTTTETIEAIDARIYSENGALHVETPQTASLRVHAITGTCFYAGTVTGHATVSGLPAGVYVVTLGNDTLKVRVH